MLLNKPRIIDAPAVILLLVLIGLFAWNGFRNKSNTVDEVVHITAGQAYWSLNDYRLAPESGNLPNRIAALSFRFGKKQYPIDTDSDSWKESNQWVVTREWWYESGHEPREMLFRARMSMLGVNLLGLGLVFLLAAHLWGRGAGYFALVVAGFSPNFLGHMPLATSDFMGAWTLVLATVCYARMLGKTSLSSIALAGLTAGVAIITKHSGLILGPVAMVLLLWQLHRDRSFRIIPASLLAALIAWAVIWTAYGWRYTAGNPAAGPFSGFQVEWVTVKEGGFLSRSIIEFGRQFRLLPEAFLFGLDFIIARSDRGGYLNGAYSPDGYKLFYFWNFLYKTPPPALLLHVTGWSFLLAALAKRQTSPTPVMRSLLVLGGAYAFILLTTRMNIGYRHAFTALFISCIISSLVFKKLYAKDRRMGMAACLLALSLVPLAALNSQRFISYVNFIGGGERKGHVNLTDSSLDWGQDLPVVADYIERATEANPDENFYLCITGTGLPEFYGIPETRFLPFWGYNRRNSYLPALDKGTYIFSATALSLMYEEWSRELEMDYRKLKMASGELYHRMRKAGTYEADNAEANMSLEEIKTVRQFEFFRCKRLIFYLRGRDPDEILNGTMLVYRLTGDELAELNW